MIMTSVSKKNSPNKKGYVGFVGSQPTLLLLHTIFRQASKSNNVGCDPTNPTYPFLFGEFFQRPAWPVNNNGNGLTKFYHKYVTTPTQLSTHLQSNLQAM